MVATTVERMEPFDPENESIVVNLEHQFTSAEAESEEEVPVLC